MVQSSTATERINTMATRSRIGILEKGGICHIYAHWDGYPKHNGIILLKHYTNAAKINLLMELGNISILRPIIGEKHDFDNPNEQWTLAYGRDREETGEKAIKSKNETHFIKIADGSFAEYAYLFKEDKWFFCAIGKNNHFIALDEYLSQFPETELYPC
jgi:hypothetical protein